MSDNYLETVCDSFTENEITKLRALFPALNLKVRGENNLIYMDWAATSQKPLSVIKSVQDYYCNMNGSINRGAHYLAEKATLAFENAREKLANFINAGTDEIVFTMNATDALNMVSNAFTMATIEHDNGPFCIKEGDEIVLTQLDHHANIVPWQQVAKRTGAKIKWIRLTQDGDLNYSDLTVINDKTKIVAFTHASNVTGVITNVHKIVETAKKYGAFTILDTCQSSAHIKIDVKKLDVDFACFSAHKMFGPTGVGALYGKSYLLDIMKPFRTGGSMIDHVSENETTFKTGYYRHEAGTLMNAQIYGWVKALEFMSEVGMNRMIKREEKLAKYLYDSVRNIDNVNIIGDICGNNFSARLPVLSFTVDNVHPHDVSQYLDNFGIAIRSGHHCAQIVHSCFNIYNSSRVSMSFLNTFDEIDKFVEVLSNVRSYFCF